MMNPAMAKCLVVSKVLIADGMMTDTERAFLAAMMDELGLTEQERAKVVGLEGLDEAEMLVSALTRGERQQLVEMLVEAASADGHLSPHELRMVQRISQALNV